MTSNILFAYVFIIALIGILLNDAARGMLEKKDYDAFDMAFSVFSGFIDQVTAYAKSP